MQIESPPISPSTRHRVQFVDASTSERLVLWHLRGTVDDLACAAIPTSYGYALGLELGGELILLQLQPTLEDLVDRAGRLEGWLLTQGWKTAERH